jgi:hypothetical protein
MYVSYDGSPVDSIQSRILILEKDGSSYKPIKIYHDNNGRKWVEARPGTEYVLEIKNNNYDRYLSVVSVDGLNVISGDTAELKAEDGYVLNAKQSLKISGWRTSMDKVRKFVFSEKSDSYAKKLGASTANVGVIGFAFFKEKRVNWGWASSATTYQPYGGYPVTYTTTNNSEEISKLYGTGVATAFTSSIAVEPTASKGTLRSMSATTNTVSAASFSVGTAQGGSAVDKVVDANYDFESLPYATDEIYYDSRENLIAKGIIVEETGLPQPFATKFCREV